MRQMILACKSRRTSAADEKPDYGRFGAKPLGGYSTQRLR
jgi:hypothetical protein